MFSGSKAFYGINDYKKCLWSKGFSRIELLYNLSWAVSRIGCQNAVLVWVLCVWHKIWKGSHFNIYFPIDFFWFVHKIICKETCSTLGCQMTNNLLNNWWFFNSFSINRYLLFYLIPIWCIIGNFFLKVEKSLQNKYIITLHIWPYSTTLTLFFTQGKMSKLISEPLRTKAYLTSESEEE